MPVSGCRFSVLKSQLRDNPYRLDRSQDDSGDSSADVLSGALATAATSTSTAGQYAITQGTLAANGNYQLAFDDGVLTVATNTGSPNGGDFLRLDRQNNVAAVDETPTANDDPQKGQPLVSDATYARTLGLTFAPDFIRLPER